MRRLLATGLVAAAMLTAVGCNHHNLRCDGPECGYDECTDGGCAPVAAPAPPQAAGHYAYPYYTLKGPRDFLYSPPAQ